MHQCQCLAGCRVHPQQNHAWQGFDALRRAHLGCLGSDGPVEIRITELGGHALPEGCRLPGGAVYRGFQRADDRGQSDLLGHSPRGTAQLCIGLGRGRASPLAHCTEFVERQAKLATHWYTLSELVLEDAVQARIPANGLIELQGFHGSDASTRDTTRGWSRSHRHHIGIPPFVGRGVQAEVLPQRNKRQLTHVSCTLERWRRGGVYIPPPKNGLIVLQKLRNPQHEGNHKHPLNMYVYVFVYIHTFMSACTRTHTHACFLL